MNASRPRVVLIESSPAAKAAAELLDLPTVTDVTRALAEDPPATLVLVVDEARFVATVASATKSGKVGAAIAWGLSETAVGRLLSVDVPVFVGVPERAALDAAIDAPHSHLECRADQRALSGRLANLERFATARDADVA